MLTLKNIYLLYFDEYQLLKFSLRSSTINPQLASQQAETR